MRKPNRFVVMGDLDTLIDIKRVNSWTEVRTQKDKLNEVFIQFKYLEKELVSVQYSNVNFLKNLYIKYMLRVIAKRMNFYKL